MIDKKKLLKNLNKHFGENNKELNDIPHESLLWYLDTLFLQIDLYNEQLEENQKSYMKLFETYNKIMEENNK